MRPTEPGWYWYFGTGCNPPEVVEVVKNRLEDHLFIYQTNEEGCGSLEMFPGTFLGPLVPPERPVR